MRYITFALAKGRLAKKAMALLEEIGITCEEMNVIFPNSVSEIPELDPSF